MSRHRGNGARASTPVTSAYLARVARVVRANPEAGPRPTLVGGYLGESFGEAFVGAPYLHSSNDVSDELDQLHGEMMQFGQEMIEQLFRQEPEYRGWDIPRADASPAMLAWRRTVWVPFWDEWMKFRDVHGNSFWQNLPLSGAWDRIQDFRQRFIQIRDGARRANFRILGPTPIQPRRDPDPMDGLKDVWGAAKVGIYLGLGVAGVFLAAAAIDRVRGLRR